MTAETATISVTHDIAARSVVRHRGCEPTLNIDDNDWAEAVMMDGDREVCRLTWTLACGLDHDRQYTADTQETSNGSGAYADHREELLAAVKDELDEIGINAAAADKAAWIDYIGETKVWLVYTRDFANTYDIVIGGERPDGDARESDATDAAEHLVEPRRDWMGSVRWI
jgi:hypothetical protein